MKRFLLLWISFIVVLTAPLLHAAEAEEPSDHENTLQEILILNSYHPGYAWSDEEQAGIIDVFRAKNENWLPVIEYLDLRRLPDGRHLAELKKLFRRKYQNQKFSVVIAMDDPALEFAINNRAGLFRNAPIVFCGINNYTPSLLKERSDVTGIAESIDLAETIEVMLRLHPAAREIFVPHDYTVTGLAVRKELEALVPRFGARVRFRFTDPLTMEELLKEMERLPEDSLVLEIGFLTDKSDHTFGLAETTKLFYEHSPVPIYSTFEQRLGFGIVGGKLLSARIHGTNAGRIAQRVLAGEKASAIPVVLESDSQFMFDYKVMSRFGIPLSALPEGSTVINKPISFYATHRVVIQTALGVIGILIMVISLLAVIIIQRRRSTIALRESKERLLFHTDNSPMAVVEWNTDFVVTRWTGAAEKMFGWSAEETIGKPIMELRMIYEKDIPIVQSAMQRLTDGKSKYVVSSNRNYTKTRQVIQCEWYNTVLYNSKGEMVSVMSQVLDITERRQAEEEKRRMEERSRKIVEDIFRFIPEGVLVFSRKMELLRQNQAFRELVSGYAKRLGFAEDELENLIVDKIKAAMGDKNVKEIRISRKHEDGEQT
jgi:two-component system cell cycle sensor histidine kinase/response regulator CckA